MKFFEGQFNRLCGVWAMHLCCKWSPVTTKRELQAKDQQKLYYCIVQPNIPVFLEWWILFIYINFPTYISFRFCCRECCLLSSPIAATLSPLTKGDVTEINKMFGTWACQSQQGSYTPLSNTSICSRQSKFYPESRGWKALHQGHKMRSSTTTAVSSTIFALMCVVSHGKNLIELCRALF